jgi:hypothetical protein
MPGSRGSCVFFPAPVRDKLGGRATRLAGVGGWYTIGLAAGLGAALGVLAASLLAATRLGLPGAMLVGAVAGGAVALAFGDWPEVVGGVLGGALAAAGAAPVARGALARGGTRAGTTLLLGLGALVLAALAFVPVLGYVEPVAAAALGVRLRRRAGERYAGLRILARD